MHCSDRGFVRWRKTRAASGEKPFACVGVGEEEGWKGTGISSLVSLSIPLGTDSWLDWMRMNE